MLLRNTLLLRPGGTTGICQCRHLIQKPKNSFSEKYRRFWQPKKTRSESEGFRNHIVQLGDPSLRARALPVDPADVTGDFIQAAIRRLKELTERYDALGMSAPQMGLAARISLVQCTHKQTAMWPKEEAKRLGLEAMPTRVMVNPVVKVLEDRQVVEREGCTSMQGYSALVARAKKVEVQYLDERGEESKWEASDWAARLVQHEVDHLEGVMFIDKMQPESLIFNYWRTVNAREGDFRMGFGGIKGIKHNFMPFKINYTSE